MKKTQIGTHLPATLHECMKEICAARGLSPARDLHLIYKEALEYYVKSVDPASGLLRRTPMPSSWSLIFPSVYEHLDCDKFADDAQLSRALDEYDRLMTWVDRPDLTCVHANLALQDYVGYPLEKFLKLNWADLLHADDRERTYRRCLTCFAGRQRFQLVYRIRRNDGKYAWIVDNVHPRHLPDGRFVGYIGTMYEVGTRAYGPPESAISEAGARELRAAEFVQNFTGILTAGSMKKRQRIKPQHDVVIFETKHHSDE